MGYTLFGMAGVFLVSPLFGALSVLLIVLVGRRLFGSVAGGAAAFLLLVNLAQFWSARTSGSEVMFQTAFLAAVLFWALYSSTGKRPYAIFAGLGFRALMLIRVDSLLVLTGVLAFFLYLYATRGVHRKDLFFILPLVAVTGLGLGDSLYSSRPYISLLYRTTPWVTPALVGLIAVAVAAGLAGTIPCLGVGAFIKQIIAGHALTIRYGLAAGLVGLAVFAYLFRPMIQETSYVNPQGLVLPRYAEESFVRLGWYLAPLGLALATIGGAAALLRGRGRALILFLLVGLLISIYQLIDPRVAPDHIWAARRYVPVVLPMSLLFIGLVVQLLGWRRVEPWSPPEAVAADPAPEKGAMDFVRRLSVIPGRVRLSSLAGKIGALVDGRIVAAGLLAALIGLSVHQIWDFVPYREQGGSASQVERVASIFPEDAVVVLEGSSAMEILAPPLKLVHGLETFVMGSPRNLDTHRALCGSEHHYPSALYPRSCVLEELAAAAGPRPFFWVTSGLGGQPRFVQEAFTRMEGYQIEVNVPKLEQTMIWLPKRSGVSRLELTGSVFQLEK